MDLLFLAIVFGLIFGSQFYKVIVMFLFPDYPKFWAMRFSVWIMCVGLDMFLIYKLWWTVFIIGAMHLIVFLAFIFYAEQSNKKLQNRATEVKHYEKIDR